MPHLEPIRLVTRPEPERETSGGLVPSVTFLNVTPEVTISDRGVDGEGTGEAGTGPLTQAIHGLLRCAQQEEAKSAADRRAGVASTNRLLARQTRLLVELNDARQEMQERTLYEATAELVAAQKEAKRAMAELEAARGCAQKSDEDELRIALRTAEDAATALNAERVHRRRLEQELAELRSQDRRAPQATAADARLTGEADGAIRVVRRLLVGRAAEALRHRATEVHTLEAGVCAEAHRRASQVRGCACAEDARRTLMTARVPEAPAADLARAVTQALLAVEEGMPADLDDHPLSEFRFGDESVDELTVELAKNQGRANLVAAAILRDSGSRFPKRTAAAMIEEACPTLVRMSASTITPIAPGPPPPTPAAPAAAAPVAAAAAAAIAAAREAPMDVEGPEGEGEP